MKRIGILYHPLKNDALTLARKLEGFLNAEGLSVWVYSAWEWETARTQVNTTDLILGIGGDGTILRTAQAVIPDSTPILGINLGQLGFMTELSVDEATTKLSALISGEGWIDSRSLLEAELISTNEKQETGKFYSLNDIVIARGAVARTIYVETRIDNEPLTTYKGDGVILSTATGSTGYALAAGGPILHPQAKESLLLPILPHLSLAYPMVLPSTTKVELSVSTPHAATLSIDGHINLTLSSGAKIIVKHSSRTIQFLRIHPENSFYSTLEQKLRGKQWTPIT